jgi:SAM-dependent methyltransferase
VGHYASDLFEAGADVVGVDIDPIAIQSARRRSNSAKFYVADIADELSFLASSSFDAILSSLVLHYLPDWSQTFAEFRRLLKPSGILVFSVHHPFVDFIESGSASYLATEPWGIGFNDSGPMGEGRFWRRSLTEMLEPLLRNGFAIGAIREPYPSAQFADTTGLNSIQELPRLIVVSASKI